MPQFRHTERMTVLGDKHSLSPMPTICTLANEMISVAESTATMEGAALHKKPANSCVHMVHIVHSPAVSP